MAGSIVTNIGLTKLSSASPLEQLNITELAVGDGNGGFPDLDSSMTGLTNEVWRGSVSNPIRDPENENILIFEAYMPSSVGGFTIREQAIFDDEGEMIAIGHTSELVKPAFGEDVGVTVTMRMHIALNSSEQVDLFYTDTTATHHNSLTNRDSTGSHPASAIETIDGRSVQERLDDLPDEVDAAGTAESKIAEHNSDPSAHPELSSFITSEADRAVTSADAAALSGNVYSDATTGMSATSDGDYFSVISTDDNAYLDLYLNDSGVAVYKKTYPNENAVKKPDGITIPAYSSSKSGEEWDLSEGGVEIIDELGDVLGSISVYAISHSNIIGESVTSDIANSSDNVDLNETSFAVSDDSISALNFGDFLNIDTKNNKLHLKNVVFDGFSGSLPDMGDGVRYAPTIYYDTTDTEFSVRTHQGIPSIAKCGSRLWAIWYGHHSLGEAAGNFCIFAYSDDDGDTWSDEQGYIAYVDDMETHRVFDPQTWCDPQGNLWFIVTVSGESDSIFDGTEGVWCFVSGNPTAKTPSFSKGFKLSPYGVGMRPFKHDGNYSIPIDYWRHNPDDRVVTRNQFVGKGVYRFDWMNKSIGLTSVIPSVTTTGFDETSIVQVKDGSLLAVFRIAGSDGVCYSRSENGITWTEPEQYAALGDVVSSRYFCGISPQGRVMIAYNNSSEGRLNMTIKLSDDQGVTFDHSVFVDVGGSYPVLEINQESEEIYIIYDKGRSSTGYIMFAKFNEDDIVNGTATSNPVIINQF